MSKIYSFLPLLILMFSCQYLVTDQFPGHDQQPTVNATLVAGNPVSLHLSFSHKIDSSTIPHIDHAIIELHEDDAFIELLDYAGSGYYFSNYIVKAGHTYSTKIIIPRFDTVFASTYIPEITPISRVEIIEKAGVNEYGSIYGAVKITFGNHPGFDNYYQVYVRFKDKDKLFETSFINYTDPIILNEGLPLALFSNAIITGSSYTLQLNFHPNKQRISGIGDLWYPFIVELRSVSHEYYQFYRSFYLYEHGRWGDGIVSPMGHISLFSNVKNGYGIFCGYSVYNTPVIDPKEGMIHE